MRGGVSVETVGVDLVRRDLQHAAGDLPTVDLSNIVDELRDVAAAGAPRRTGAGIASFSTGKVGGLDTFSVGLLYMSVQEFGSHQRNIRARHFVGHALDLMSSGRAAVLADDAVSDLLAANHLGD